MLASGRFHIQGRVSRGFEAVRETFIENFSRRRELGGACCVFHRGEKVVDLWGGIRNKRTGESWEENTMVVVHSASTRAAGSTMKSGPQRRAIFRYSGFLSRDGKTTSRLVCESRGGKNQ